MREYTDGELTYIIENQDKSIIFIAKQLSMTCDDVQKLFDIALKTRKYKAYVEAIRESKHRKRGGADER